MTIRRTWVFKASKFKPSGKFYSDEHFAVEADDIGIDYAAHAAGVANPPLAATWQVSDEARERFSSWLDEGGFVHISGPGLVPILLVRRNQQ